MPASLKLDRHGAVRTVAVGLLLLLMVGGGGCSKAPERPDLRNIVLVTIDTLRADHLRSYGYKRRTSPTIDAFARESILFENCMTPLAATLPAHVSLLTGTYPMEHGILGNAGLFRKGKVERGGKRYVSRPGVRSVAEMALERGYRTAAFVSAAPVNKETGINAGFEVFDDPAKAQRRASTTNARVFPWLDEIGDEPFFLWVHYYDPHYPYEPPPELLQRYPTDKLLERYMRLRQIPDTATRPNQQVLNTRPTINGYDAEVLYVDGQLWQLFERLRDNGLWDDTAVILTSDHGEGLGEHGMIGHGYIYREQLHVPLMMRIPGEQAREHRVPISLVDALPTALGMIDREGWSDFLEQASGVDVSGPDYRFEPIFSQRSARERPDVTGPSFALTTGRYKFIHEPEGQDRLFNWMMDPYELYGRLEKEPEVAPPIKEQLIERIRIYEERGRELAADGEQEAMDPELTEKLRSLGYID